MINLEPKEQKPTQDILPNIYSLFDFIFPGGKLAKLAKIETAKITDAQLLLATRAFKFVEGVPVIVMAGARESGRGKFLAGLSRAAFRSDAVILDSGVETGIENYCLRRSKLPSYSRCKADWSVSRKSDHYAKDQSNPEVPKSTYEWPHSPIHALWKNSFLGS